MIYHWNTMTPRERDVLVAEKVMGIEGVRTITLIDGDGPRDDFGTLSEPYLMADGRMGRRASQIKHYTTSIADAFEVVEKMEQEGFGWLVSRASAKAPFTCWFGENHEGRADTKEEAINIAALRACGVEVTT